jgi:hypothetical protein
MTPEQKFQQLFEEMYDLCQDQGWGDPFSYARSREIHLAGVLGHRLCDTYSGADGFDQDGGAEYKTTTQERIQGTYNGISVQTSWEEQERYILEDKIGKYANHYFARYASGKIVEIWKVNAQSVLDVLLPKIKNQYPKKRKGFAKDPRIGVTMTMREIKKYGTQIR